MKIYNAQVSFTGNASITVTANSKEEAEEKIFERFNPFCEMQKDKSIEVAETNWSLLRNCRGNVAPAFVSDFYIEEEGE